jgi:hypothetical protein
MLTLRTYTYFLFSDWSTFWNHTTKTVQNSTQIDTTQNWKGTGTYTYTYTDCYSILTYSALRCNLDVLMEKMSTLSLTLRLLMSYIYMEHLFLMFIDHTQRCSTGGRTPLDEWSARRRDLYLTTHDTRNRQISMPPAAAGRSPAEIVGSTPTGDMDICLLWVSCVVR